MSGEIDLKKIAEVLARGNPALKKRALALIFHESVVEAKPLVESFLGTETDSTLRSMAMQVMRSLESFEKESSLVDTDKISLLLESSDPSCHLTALRALRTRVSPEIPDLIREYCAQGGVTTEAAALIVEILKNNPSLGNLENLSTLLVDPNENIRCESFEAILNVLHSCIYPLLFQPLLDSSQKVKMKAYQFLGGLGRAAFLDSLQWMLQNPDPEYAHRACRLLIPFSGKDLIPILRRHLAHADPETALDCRNALLYLAQKGESEAAAILNEVDALEESQEESEEEPIEIPVSFQELLKQFPEWLIGGDPQTLLRQLPCQTMQRVKGIYSHIRKFLNVVFVNAYFHFGERENWIDLACFRALQRDISQADTVQLLRAITPALPDPESGQDLFPLVLGRRILDDLEERFLEQLLSFEEVFKHLGENPGESRTFFLPSLQGLEELLRRMLPLLVNRIYLKIKVENSFRVLNFTLDPPETIEAKLLADFDLPFGRPLLVSGNGLKSMVLSPFLIADKDRFSLIVPESNEQLVSELLNMFGCLDAYLRALVEDYVFSDPAA